MRVLHTISGIDPRNGGPAVALAGLARSQQTAGIAVSLASTWCIQPSPDTPEALGRDGVNVHLLGPCRDPMSRHPALSGWLEPLIADADLVHIHGAWEAIQHQSAALCRKLAKPYVFSLHGMLNRWNMNNGRLKKRLYLRWRLAGDLRHSAAIHYVTEQERRWNIPLSLPRRSIVEPFGVDLAGLELKPGMATFLERYTNVAGHPFVLFLGRIDRGKGWEHLIPAFAKAAADPRLRDWLLVVAGPDYFGNLAKAQALAAHNGIASRTIFTGMLDAAGRAAALHGCEMLALPSEHENFGIVVAEAMACGRPVLVSDQVALHHDVTRANAGAVTSLKMNDIAESLRSWMVDAPRREAAGAAGRKMAREQFDWRSIGQRWAKHYAEIAAG